jgi:hypothetical protein
MATHELDKKVPKDAVDHRLTEVASNIVDDEPATVAMCKTSVDDEASKSGTRAPPSTPVSCMLNLLPFQVSY